MPPHPLRAARLLATLTLGGATQMKNSRFDLLTTQVVVGCML